jgi:hypothetical protein
MIDTKLILSGGLKFLKGEAMASVSSAQKIFTNAPPGTVVALITIRTAGLTMTFDGITAPTAGAVGQDYALNGAPYAFWLNDANLKLVQAIQNGGSSTAYITYFGLMGA